MARFYRLVLIALFLVAGSSAHALVNMSRHYLVQVLQAEQWFSSSSAACSAAIAYANTGVASPYSYVGKGFVEVSANAGQCNYDYMRSGELWSTGGFGVSIVLRCPANSTVSGSQCQCASGFTEYDSKECRPPCPAGQHEEGGACVPDNCKPDEVRVNGICVKEPACPPGETRVNGVCKKDQCPKGKDMGSYDTGGPDATIYLCEGGCTVKATSSICVTWDGKSMCSGTGRTTGSSCDGGGDWSGGGPEKPGTGGPGNPGTGDPGTGGNTGGGTTGGGTTGGGTTGGGTTGGGTTGGGTTGGGTTGGGTTGGGTTGGGTTGGGTTGGGTTGGTGSGSGIGLPAPVTSAPDASGGCSAGKVLSSDGKYCLEGPKAPDGDGNCPAGMVKIGTMCHSTEPVGGGGNGDGDGEGDESGFGGQCSAGFTCEGDAIQCAIAKEQHIRACQLMENKSAESELYGQEKGKEGKRTGDLPGNENHDLNGRINSSDLLGGGAGLQDLSITVMGSTINLPLSRLNSYLSALGNVLLAVSFLMAVRIVGRG